ncbi:hypothetical protein AB5N19_04870 [Seiridium cardinale]|uniref:2EXR domain-containing protein n=1 Tax=Seiridium cardinale TaxID=138064 RepID=A0ABR2XFT9_9PEZI
MSLSGPTGANSSFNILPLELKELVWLLSLPGEVSEVALLPAGLRPIIPLGPRPDDSAEHLVIYTAYPVLLHVCREWRVFAMARTTFRYCQAAMMDVPSRPFRTDLDVLYIPAVDSSPVWFSGDPRCSVTRHIAMQPHTFLNYGARSLALMTYFKNIETLTIVLPSSTGHHSLHATFAAPSKRCQLRRISNAALDDLGALSLVQDYGSSTSALGQVAKVSRFLKWIEVAVQRTTQYLQATQEWNPSGQGERDGCARPLRVGALAQTFVEYRFRNGTGGWTEG